MARLNVAVLISGRGSNLQALIDAVADPAFPARIALVVSNVPGAGGLARAEAAGIETRVLDHRDYADREEFETDLLGILADSGTEFLCLAGFMRLLSAGFVERWHNRLINIHPSLLPGYKGLDTHARVLADGATETGCTVHFVRPAMDEGPAIVQARVPVRPGDDEATLAARVLAAEHRCYPLALRLIAEDWVAVSPDGDRVTIRDAAAPGPLMIDSAEDTPAAQDAGSETGHSAL